MPNLYFGSTKIKTVYHGSTKIKKIYLGSSLVYASAFAYTYTVDTSLGRNLYNDLIGAGWDGSSDVDVTINAGVDIGAPNISTYALDCNSMPNGVTLTLINKGYIRGAGGAGGIGADDDGSGSAGAGSAGGPALRLGCITIIDNSAGYIYGGGGGGGGGGMHTRTVTTTSGDGKGGTYTSTTRYYYGGAGGSGGAGWQQGVGGTERISGSYNGNPGTLNAGGASVTPPTYHLPGGAGGGPGSAGASGSSGGSSGGNVSSSERLGGAGGAAGRAIYKNGFTPTFISGNTSSRVKGAVS